MDKKELPNKFILIEGIDGSGKSTFAKYFEEELKSKYKKSKTKSLSIFGQPSYRLEKRNNIFNMIEFGKVSGDIKKDINIFKQNRVKHEKHIKKNYKGLKICIRGVLTDLGTIYSKYRQYRLNNLGQNIEIDLLIIIDTPIMKALARIKSRDIIQWRESYLYLQRFKRLYSNRAYINRVLKPKKIITIKNNRDIEQLKKQAKEIAREQI